MEEIFLTVNWNGDDNQLALWLQNRVI